jgi:ABC-2 type transport system permease protein
MIKHIFAITVKELQILWQDRPALALLFLMPTFFIVVMSFALENVFEAGTKKRPLTILIVDEDQGPVAARILEELKAAGGIRAVTEYAGAPLDAAGAERLVAERTFPMALLLPQGLSQAAARAESEPLVVPLVVDPATNRQFIAPVRGAIEGLLQGALLFEKVPRELRSALETWDPEGTDAPLPGRLLASLEKAVTARLGSMDSDSLVRIHVTFPRGMQPHSKPSATQQSVPAYTIFGVFFITLTLATSFVRERTEGTMTRLLVAPLLRPTLLLGKLLPYYLVNLGQIVLMFTVGALLFDLDLGDPIALVVVSLALGAAATGLGLLIAAFGRTEAQVGALAVSSSITLAALGGLMVPSFVMPGPMQKIAVVTPHAWALAAYHDVMLRGGHVAAVFTEVTVLVGFAAVFFAAAALRLRFH